MRAILAKNDNLFVSYNTTFVFMCVCVCVCHTHVLYQNSKRLNIRIMQTTPHDSPGTPVWETFHSTLVIGVLIEAIWRTNRRKLHTSLSFNAVSRQSQSLSKKLNPCGRFDQQRLVTGRDRHSATANAVVSRALIACNFCMKHAA